MITAAVKTRARGRAKAKGFKPVSDGAYTPVELWRAVAAMRIFLHPPRLPATVWLAGWSNEDDEQPQRVFAQGLTPVEAVEKLLRKIGEAG